MRRVTTGSGGSCRCACHTCLSPLSPIRLSKNEHKLTLAFRILFQFVRLFDNLTISNLQTICSQTPPRMILDVFGIGAPMFAAESGSGTVFSRSTLPRSDLRSMETTLSASNGQRTRLAHILWSACRLVGARYHLDNALPQAGIVKSGRHQGVPSSVALVSLSCLHRCHLSTVVEFETC